ncbi:electron transport complex subunit RsxC [Porticoccus sp. W117]|uniref:electron transport complex subunit RsxC n=1 Tax=Porticoccus sp. W117 TaxID=3054777 RepID=UPI0025912CF7|nr:electron transport complex subunit RsxC [Porticoccus sp. W117]MDM3870955.1 electron transport complex subunit RsxC [Porticoccus sp. W117]
MTADQATKIASITIHEPVIHKTPGGIHPPDNKQQSLQRGLGIAPLPEKLVLPLNQHSGAPATPIVAVGDTVLKGQKIAEPSGSVSAAVHAPTSGTVTAIGLHPVAHPSGMNAPCITIESDGKEQWCQRNPVSNFTSQSPQTLLASIRDAGIAGLGGAGFPSHIKLSAADNGQAIDTLIINATECEPYITADDQLMRSYPQQVVTGIQILAHILGQPQRILIGIEDNKPQACDALQPHLQSTGIQLAKFPTKYPSGGEKQLIQILTGKELPNGRLPADMGIVCQNIGTVHAIYRAIVEGTPLISRITTITGDACAEPQNLETLIGTPMRHLLEHCGYQAQAGQPVVMGGPMMGFALTDLDAPAIKTTNCLLAPSTAEMPPQPPAQPCIRCGLCAEACPANLLPQQLLWHAQARNHQRLQSHNLFDCIECGACAYVCPSHIPLVQHYRAAKAELRQAARERIKSDRARERFEYNKQRKQQAEAEKAAKREARRIAAEQAKATLAKTHAQQEQTPTEQASDVVQAALQQVAAKQASPEQQRAKLERSVNSAESRLQRLEKKLAEGQAESSDAPLSEEQVSGYQAQIESARLKLTETQQKLKEFNNGQQTNLEDKVTAKVLASPKQTADKKVASLQKRLTGIEEKLAACDDDDLRQALENSASKFRSKLQDAQQEASALAANSGNDKPVTDPATVAATQQALAANKQKAPLTPQQQVERLQQRMQKAEERLATLSDPVQIDALQTSLANLQQKLADAQRALENP